MRFYEISFTNINTGQPITGADSSIPAKLSSHNDGIYNPGALEVEFEIANGFGHMIGAQTHIRIHNPTLDMVEQSIYYNNSFCTIKAGFGQGLPLANPKQAGIVATGIVQNSYANWLGTDLVLDFLLFPNYFYGNPDISIASATGTGSPYQYNFEWSQGSLKDSLIALFGKFGYEVKGNISAKLNTPPPRSWQASYTDFQGFADFINRQTKNYIDPPTYNQQGNSGNFQKYYGVMMSIVPNARLIEITDGTEPTGAITLERQEFIGQPTWTGVTGALQSVHPMRADINMGYEVIYPTNLPTTANPSNIVQRDQLVTPSGGRMMVTGVRHMGRFRDTSPNGWVTFIDAARFQKFNPNEAPLPKGEVTIEPLIPVS